VGDFGKLGETPADRMDRPEPVDRPVPQGTETERLTTPSSA